MSDKPSRWILSWFHPHHGWREVAAGRSRARAAIALLICTLARPTERHNLRWNNGSNRHV